MRVTFYTLGCKVNQNETGALAQLFEENGYTVVSNEEPADVYVVNSCTVTNFGDQKSRKWLRRAKRENYEKIYSKGGIEGDSEAELREAFEKLYDRCLLDINEGDESSYIFKHHISRIEQQLSYYDRAYAWQNDKAQAVVDYIASMTDGYFCELTSKLFPGLKFPHRTYINER